MKAKNSHLSGSAETVKQAQTKLLEISGKIEKATRIYNTKKQTKE